MNSHLRGVKYNEEKSNNNRKLEKLMVQWFEATVLGSLCMVQFYLLPSPPGQPRGQVQPFRPGGGELFEVVLSRG